MAKDPLASFIKMQLRRQFGKNIYTKEMDKFATAMSSAIRAYLIAYVQTTGSPYIHKVFKAP